MTAILAAARLPLGAGGGGIFARVLRTKLRRSGLKADVEISADGIPVGVWRGRSRLRHKSEAIDLGGSSCVMVRDRAMKHLSLQVDGVQMATLERISYGAFRGRSWRLDGPPGGYLLRWRNSRKMTFELDGAEAGVVRPEGALRSSYVADLPESLPLPVQVFVLWATLAVTQRATAAAAGAAGATGV